MKCQIPGCERDATHGGHSVKWTEDGERYVESTSTCAWHKCADFDGMIVTHTMILGTEDAELFARVLANPPAPNEALKAAMSREAGEE